MKRNRTEWGQQKHQNGQNTRDGKVESIIRPEKQEDKLTHRSGNKEAPKEGEKNPTFMLDERSPAGVEEGDGAELPPERRRLECSHPGLLARLW